ncbi:hypothetical protein LPB136_01780 [Tenacibaculum todarodis]|uniref:Alpha/beta hydrolase n=1 Tax=Tenacibaculum todarodis TaxID=1850252 RepID=A0A1L3JGC8_9FLAO|nr:hypothetical protein [Tenacibaculum todarodis]APG64172.1 hypothetical protein LPB136_01780 [Tenacibaculum todarodis]
MKKNIGILFILIIFSSCKNSLYEKKLNTYTSEYKNIIEDSYELNNPVDKANAVLILFGNYAENAKAIEREFKILKDAKENNIAVLYLNFNQKFWLTEKDKIQLTNLLKKVFKDSNLPKNNIYIGGFSTGGNISLLLSNHLIKTSNNIQPKGVFVVDSPIDILAFYKKCERNIKRNFSEISVQEGTWLINLFNTNFGNPNDNISNFENNSPFTSETNFTGNISSLKNTKIRLYTEPDFNYWKVNRRFEKEDLNAYSIEKLSNVLQKKFNNNKIELIKTVNKGYRSNGERNPHSWSIVDKKSLIKWMLNN